MGDTLRAWAGKCYTYQFIPWETSMYRDTYDALCVSALAKADVLRHDPVAYFVASMVAGLFITLGGMVAMSVGGFLAPLMGAAARLPAALAFSAALSLAVMAGCELFTGNNLILSAASLRRRLTWRATLLLWLTCWVGNVFGVWGTLALYHFSGAAQVEAVAAYFAETAAAKVALSPLAMVLRGILCNICVCLAIWCGFRMRSESGKLIMTLWCVFIFMVCGFEHSVANMGIVGVALLNPMGHAVTLRGYALSLGFVTLGNILGAVLFVALPYARMARRASAEGGTP